MNGVMEIWIGGLVDWWIDGLMQLQETYVTSSLKTVIVME